MTPTETETLLSTVTTVIALKTLYFWSVVFWKCCTTVCLSFRTHPCLAYISKKTNYKGQGDGGSGTTELDGALRKVKGN